MDMSFSMIKRTNCVVCNHTITPFYSFPHFPLKLTCDNEAIYGDAELSYGVCKYCNTIQLDKLVPLEILYSSSHNYTSMGNVWNNYFHFFNKTVAPHIVDKTVMEVGCPSGKIALQSSHYKKWYIVEPNKKEGLELPPTVEFIERFFDDNLIIQEEINVIVHSHLYEHIYEPRRFLQKCRSLLYENGKMIFSIPNMEHISKNSLCPCNGVFYEHTVYYTVENVSYLLETSGFTNIQVFPFENHSILFYCEKGGDKDILNTPPPIPILPKDSLALFTRGIECYEDITQRCIEYIYNNNNNNNKQDEENPIYVFGASYNTLFLLYFLKRNKEINVKGILDNNPDKQGKYLFGTGLKIFAPSILTDLPQVCVILKNGYYCEEIKEQILLLRNNNNKKQDKGLYIIE